MATLIGPSILLATALPLLILSEANSFYPGSGIFKLASSTAFVWRSLSQTPATQFTFWSPELFITASLICGWLGDLCLIPSRRSYFAPGGGHEGDSVWFKLGMLAFMLNHAGYIFAFISGMGSLSLEMNWGLFALVFAVSVGVGDVMGMPVPWRKSSAIAAAGSSIHSQDFSTTKDEGIDFLAEDEKSTVTTSTSSYSQRIRQERPMRPKLHSRTDSGISDLSFSTTPPTPTTKLRRSPSPPSLPSPTRFPTSKTHSLIPTLFVPPDMAPLVIIYQVIISAMVAAAAGTRGLDSLRALGAVMFMVSDVIVALDTFGVSDPLTAKSTVAGSREGWELRSVGWGLYFGGQFVLAAYGAL